MNKYTVNLPEVMVATNNTDAMTGNTGARWIGVNSTASGVAGNIGNGDGILYTDSIESSKTDTAISKLVSLNIPDLVGGDKDNYIQVLLSSLEFSSGVDVFGIVALGITDKSADTKVIASRSLVDILFIRIIRDALIIKIPDAATDYLKNKTLNLMVYYR